MSILSILGHLIKQLGQYLGKLLKDTEDAFNDLPQAQQDAIKNGVQISQIIKDNIQRGETYVKEVIISRLNLSPSIVDGLFDQLSKDLKYESILNGVADKIGQQLTDIAYNEEFEKISKFAAMFLGAGAVNWITLALGVIEYAYQWLKGKDQLIKPINTAMDFGDPVPVDPAHPPKP